MTYKSRSSINDLVVLLKCGQAVDCFRVTGQTEEERIFTEAYYFYHKLFGGPE